MTDSEDVLEDREESKEEKILTMTQFVEEGLEADGVDLDTLFGYPVSCKVRMCKGIMQDEAEVKNHQKECHPR